MRQNPQTSTSPSRSTVPSGGGSTNDAKSDSRAPGRVVTLATRLEASRVRLHKVEAELEKATKRRSELVDRVNAMRGEVQAHARALREEL